MGRHYSFIPFDHVEILPKTPNGKETPIKDGTKIKTPQMKSQWDSSFPTGHNAILNKLNS